MSLNNIELNTSLVADLYRAVLIDITETPPPKGEKKPASTPLPAIPEPRAASNIIKYLGEFKKSILIIVRYGDCPYLPDAQLNFLTSVLAACKLNLGDVAILNIAHVPLLHKAAQEKFKSSFTILFGLTPEEFEMPISFPEFQVQSFNNCTFLHTPVLEALDADKLLKSKLWVCLRKMFGV